MCVVATVQEQRPYARPLGREATPSGCVGATRVMSAIATVVNTVLRLLTTLRSLSRNLLCFANIGHDVASRSSISGDVHHRVHEPAIWSMSWKRGDAKPTVLPCG